MAIGPKPLCKTTAAALQLLLTIVSAKQKRKVRQSIFSLPKFCCWLVVKYTKTKTTLWKMATFWQWRGGELWKRCKETSERNIGTNNYAQLFKFSQGIIGIIYDCFRRWYHQLLLLLPTELAPAEEAAERQHHYHTPVLVVVAGKNSSGSSSSSSSSILCIFAFCHRYCHTGCHPRRNLLALLSGSTIFLPYDILWLWVALLQ